MKPIKVIDHIGSKKRYVVRIYNSNLCDTVEGKKEYTAILAFAKRDIPIHEVIKGATANTYIQNQGYFVGRDGIALSFDLVKTPIRSGDKHIELNPELAGMLYVSSKSNVKPYIYKRDENGKTVITEEIPDGTMVRATLEFFPYNFNGNAGVNCAITKLRVLKNSDEKEDEEDE